MSATAILDDNLANQVSGDSTKADSLTKQAIIDGKLQKEIAELKGINQNIEERKRYAEYIFSFTCIWCLLVFFFLFFVALGKFTLSDLVVTTLIGSTTINVLVFFRLVTEYLFNKQKSTNF